MGLNEDGRQETVVVVAGPIVCGTGGCPVLVFASPPGGYRRVARLSGAQPPAQVSPAVPTPWLDGAQMLIPVFGSCADGKPEAVLRPPGWRRGHI